MRIYRKVAGSVALLCVAASSSAMVLAAEPAAAPMPVTRDGFVSARPTDPAAHSEVAYPGGATVRTICEAVCVHWVESGEHAPPADDEDSDRVPDQVESVIETYAHVVATEVDVLGFQPPAGDSDSSESGPNGLHDVYLADVSDVDLPGFCASDDPDLTDETQMSNDVSAYCVLDNDFTDPGFPGETPLEALQVTAAHEFFHVLQAGYDFDEDVWFMEASASWVEDIVFDEINDNYRYLSKGAIPYPDFPIDHWDASDPERRYSSWLFISFLTEYMGGELAPANDTVREMWERAANRAAHPEDVDMYSMQAITETLVARGFEPEVAIANFHMNNWAAQDFYEEGQAYHDYLVANFVDPRPYVTKTHWFSRRIYTSGRWEIDLLHLSALNIGFKPRPGLPVDAQLRVEVDAPAAKRSPVARFVVLYLDGSYNMGYLRLNSKGDGTKIVDFGGGVVDRVILTLVNASTRYEACGSGTNLSCGGTATDELVPFRWRASVY